MHHSNGETCKRTAAAKRMRRARDMDQFVVGSRHWRWLAIALAAWPLQAFCAPHLEPCKRIDDYQERVERVMRGAWPEQMDLLVIMYVPLTERGIGLTHDQGGFNLIRLEFDVSFWYSSWRDVKPGVDDVRNRPVATDVYRTDGRPLASQILDFSKTKVRVSKSSVPISEKLGNSLLSTFKHSADRARVDAATDEIVVDGYSFEILLSRRDCVQLSNPPRESEAGQLDQLVRFLDRKSREWRPSEKESFEAEILQMIPE